MVWVREIVQGALHAEGLNLIQELYGYLSTVRVSPRTKSSTPSSTSTTKNHPKNYQVWPQTNNNLKCGD